MIESLFADLSTILILANILLGLAAASFELLCVLELNDKLYRWLKILYTILCLYWSVIYVVVLISTITGLGFASNAQFGSVFVRPGITYTLALITCGALYRYRILRKRKDNVDEVNKFLDEAKKRALEEHREKEIPRVE